MNTIYLAKLYAAALVVFLGIDAIWLTQVAPSFYKKNIGHLMAEKPNLIAAGVFYFLNIFGILIFAVIPGLNSHSIKNAALFGALYGFLTYATYDLTNLATLKDWPLKVTITDIVWGTFLSSAVAAATYYIGTKLS